MMLKTVIFVLVQIEKVTEKRKADFFVFIGYPNLKDIRLHAHNWQLRQSSRDWGSCNVFQNSVCSLVGQVLVKWPSQS